MHVSGYLSVYTPPPLSKTMWPGPRLTCTPSGILIHPTIWPQYTNVVVRTRQTTVQQHRANCFTNGRPKITMCNCLVITLHTHRHQTAHVIWSFAVHIIIFIVLDANTMSPSPIAWTVSHMLPIFGLHNAKWHVWISTVKDTWRRARWCICKIKYQWLHHIFILFIHFGVDTTEYRFLFAFTHGNVSSCHEQKVT